MAEAFLFTKIVDMSTLYEGISMGTLCTTLPGMGSTRPPSGQ